MSSTVRGRDGRQAIADSLYVVGLWLMDQQRLVEAAAVARALVRLAPRDDRSWLALGACHEQGDQPEVALEIYGVGRVLAAPAPRCELARARLLRLRGLDGEARDAYDLAAGAAEQARSEDLSRLVEGEGSPPW
jgi:regulator of sirC expression with transglutaminase-like and TPR domain